jgi:putative beta-lysine N-acetyltransferase
VAKSKLLFTPSLSDPRLLDLNIDLLNGRILVRHFDPKRWNEVEPQLMETALEANTEKIIVLARQQEIRHLLRNGFVLEATVDHFFKHEPVYYMSRFLTQERREAAHWVQEDELLFNVFKTEGRSLPPLRPQVSLRMANSQDVPQLLRIYRQTFATYPSSLTDSANLKESLQKNLFVLAEEKGQVVSAAAAELDPAIQAAEITHCATNPSHRGQGLITRLIRLLEQELPHRGIVNAYSIARARSFGMNVALYQQKYIYGGRLINNCTICGGYEDMNVWGKRLIQLASGTGNQDAAGPAMPS